MPQSRLCLTWNEHSNEIQSHFNLLLHNDSISDVTIICGEKCEKISAHKIVLCTASDYFNHVFNSLDKWMLNPVLILKDVSSSIVNILLEFIYTGKVNVEERKLDKVLSAAKYLGIKGLQEANSSYEPIVKVEHADEDFDICHENINFDNEIESNFEVSLILLFIGGFFTIHPPQESFLPLRTRRPL